MSRETLDETEAETTCNHCRAYPLCGCAGGYAGEHSLYIAIELEMAAQAKRITELTAELVDLQEIYDETSAALVAELKVAIEGAEGTPAAAFDRVTAELTKYSKQS